MNRNVLITRPTNHRGLPVNEAHHLARFSDAQVRRARALRAGGATVRAIAAAIGCHPSTAHRWVTDNMRRPAVSVRVVRLKDPGLPPEGMGQVAHRSMSGMRQKELDSSMDSRTAENDNQDLL